MSTNLRYVALYKNSTSTLVDKHCNENGKDDSYKNEANKVFLNVKNLNLQPEERQKMSTNNGSWYCKTDDKDIFYMVLVNLNYPERHAYSMLQEIQYALEGLANYENETIDNLKRHTKNKLKELAIKYDDLKSIDKISKAQASVSEVQNIMTNNISKMMENRAGLDSLSSKADNMRNQAHEFKNQSTDLAKIMYWRNMKLKIILGIIVLSIVCYIVVPVVSKLT